MNTPDSDTIKAILAGDHQAYEKLIKKYEPQLTCMMWRFTRDRAECERLVQDVFVEAYFSLKRYRGKAPLIHWLRTIGTRVGYRFWKEQEKQRKLLPIQEYDPIDTEFPKEIDAETAATVLHELLSRLPVADRLVMTLMYFENCSTGEIARQSGSTRAAVKMRALRARKKLKQLAEKNHLWEKLGWTD